MSYHCYSIDGYGIDVSEVVTEMHNKFNGGNMQMIESVMSFLETAPNTKKPIEEYVVENCITTWEDFMEYDEDYYLGLATILADALYEKYNIRFTQCENFDGTWYVLYEPSYPWSTLTETEKNLTPEILDKIYVDMTTELCGKGIKGEYLSVENGG